MQKFLFGIICIFLLVFTHSVSVGVYDYFGTSKIVCTDFEKSLESDKLQKYVSDNNFAFEAAAANDIFQDEKETAIINTEPNAKPIFYTLQDSTQKTENEPTPENIMHKARLSAVGDIMLHSYQYNNAYSKETGNYEFDSCFELVAPYLKAADITIGNLETVLGGPELPYSDYPRFNAPDSYGEAIKNAGFNLLTTANNHQNDKGEAGILRTLDFLDSLGINHVGSYRTSQERDSILILEADTITFAFLSYTYGTNGLPLTKGKDYLVNVISEELIKADLKRAKELNPDFIIVLPHMGNEYETTPKNVFKNWVRFILESGADIVLASHPHVVQGVERLIVTDESGEIRECFAAYSLGNFISAQRIAPRDEGVILNMEFNKINDEHSYISKISFIPTWVMITNGKGKPDVKVMPIGSILSSNLEGKPVNVRPNDIERMKAANKNLKNIMLGESGDLNEILTEYTIYEFYTRE